MIIIGSIIAVAILIGVSFTSVVGYQSTSRTITEISPLFTVRSSRALDIDSKDLSFNYVGKGEATKIYLPERNDRIESVDNLINFIKRMDDKSLQRFTYLIMYYLHNNEDTQEFYYEEILQSLKELKDNPDIINQYMTEESKVLTNLCNTFYLTGPCMPPLHCLAFELMIIFGIIYNILFLPIYIILSLLTLATNNCP